MPNKIYNIQEVAIKLGKCTNTIRNYIKNGKLPAKLVSKGKGLEYQISGDDLTNYLNNNGKDTSNLTNFSYQIGSSGIKLLDDFFSKIYQDYQGALVRLGQLENQRLMLTERAESLQKIEETYQRELEDLKRELERERIEKEILAQKLTEMTKKKKWWQFSWR